MKTRSLKVAAEGIAGGNGVMECVNLISVGAGVGLRTLTTSEWAEINAITGENGSDNVYSGNKFIRKAADFPSVKFEVKEEGIMQSQTESYTPRDGDLRGINPLSEKDLENYSEILDKAYSSIYLSAGKDRMLIQPILLRYKLLDETGRTLFTSVPCIAASSAGWQLAGVHEAKISKRSETDFTIESMVMTAKAYSLWVTIPETGPDSEVKTVEIQMSYQLHPVDFYDLAEVRTVNSSGNNPTARIGLPGATTGLSSREAERSERVKQMLARAEKTMSTVARYGTGGERKLLLQPEGRVGVKIIKQVIDRILEEEVSVNEGGNETLMSVNIPNGFKAALMTSSGDTTLYSGITSLLYSGSDPREMTQCDAGDDVISLRSTVRLTNNRTVQKEVELRGDFRTLCVNAIAGYPHHDALSMRIEAKSGKEVKSLELDLTPTLDARMAINIATDMRKREMQMVESQTWEEYEQTTDELALPEGTVVCGRTGEGGIITGATRTDGKIRGCFPADRSTSSWDNSKGHFYIVTDRGTEGVTADGKSGTISVTELSREQLTTGMTGGEGCFYAGTANGIVRLCGGKQEMAVRGLSVNRIAWWSRAGMLAAVTPEGRKWLIDSKGRRYEITHEGDAFRWVAAMKSDEATRAMRICNARVRMRDEDMKGSVEVTGHGKGCEELLTRVSFNRNIDEPLTINGIISPQRVMVGLRVTGMAKRAIIDGAEVMMKPSYTK